MLRKLLRGMGWGDENRSMLKKWKLYPETTENGK